MNFALSEEQRLLAESAGAFVGRSWPPARLRALDSGADDAGAWPAMAALGWPGLVVPEAHGGAGRGAVELALVCEQLGRGPVPSPLVVSSTLAALPLVWAGTVEQRHRWLPGLASGERVGTLALLEPGMRDEWDPVRLSGAGPLSGTKLLVPWGAVAELVLVATVDGLRIVELPSPAVRVEAHDALGGDPVAVVTLDRCRAEPLGTADDGPATLRRALDHAAVGQLAYVAGVAERMLELTVQHAKDRHQFGRPIGSFQAVAHRCAEMRADVDACRQLAYQAAWALDRGGCAEIEVTAAKSYANDAVRRVAVHAHQVHGAIGFSTEHDLHRFTRCAKAFELAYGGTARHRERLAAAMGLRG